ncbi:MAG TPA: ABC transporter permease, partial [Geminicoccaceae bacterium]|nr:ABC transporter permease [Geminicoccaceae bacterium]
MSARLGKEERRGAGAAGRGVDPIDLLGRFAPVIFLLVLMVAFSILEPRFLQPLNLFNVMRQISITGLIAIGMTFVILTAGIDLSVGSLLALAGLAAAMVAKGGTADRFAVGAGAEAAGYGWFAALLAAVAVGLAGGFIQGFAITRLKVPPFVVTLGGLSAFRGLALLIAGGGPISGFDAAYRWWGQGRIGDVPVPVIVFLLFAVLAHVVL